MIEESNIFYLNDLEIREVRKVKYKRWGGGKSTSFYDKTIYLMVSIIIPCQIGITVLL